MKYVSRSDQSAVLRFLMESNNIEGVFDDQSLFDAYQAWIFILKKKELNPFVIKKVHKILMEKQPFKPFPSINPTWVGVFRSIPVWIEDKSTPDPILVDHLISNWCQTINKHISANVDTWRQDHVSFEIIHPFVVGNGRTGRILMNWQRVRMGLEPYTVYNNEKQKYYDWFP